MKGKSLAELIHRAQVACADVLAAAPMADSDRIRTLARTPGAQCAMTVTPDGLTIHIVAGSEYARAFAYGVVGTFPLSGAA